jgi:2-hydroxychromene-2-carboxylate isomerase
MTKALVKYYFAFESPFAALADTRIDDLVEHAGAELVPIPVAPPPSAPLTGVAAEVQAFKVSYLLEEAARWAASYGLAWNPAPRTDVVSPDAVAGYFFAQAKARERAFRKAVFRARWSAGRDNGDHGVLADCAEEAGLDRREFLDAVASQRFHQEIPKALLSCREDRIFGVPIFVVHGKRIWGNDRLDDLARELGVAT